MKKIKWLLVWLAQIGMMLAAGAVVALLDMVHPILFGIASWAAMPILGLLSACWATRRGLLNYAAWIAPPVCMWLSHYLIWQYSPAPGPALLTAFVSLVGAAAGEVLNQQKKR